MTLSNPTRGRSARLLALVLCLALPGAGCSKRHSPTAPAPLPARTYGMGFSWFPPRPDLALALQVADLAAAHSDRALVLISPPWDALLDGLPADSLVRSNPLGLAEYYRARGLRVVVSIDPTDGIDRSQDAPALVSRGRSLTEPEVQQLYRRYVVAVDTLLRPDLLGIASETNLVRAIAPPGFYAALVQTASAAAADVHAVDAARRLFVTVQVEVAWGRPSGAYVGVAQDRVDFAFVDALGMSSFPHLGGFDDPDSLPADYYARLGAGSTLPLFALEGGWPSDAGSGIASSEDEQRRYMSRHAALLDSARATHWFQINFTDLDDAYWPAGMRPFARLGLVNASLQTKPALAEWDAVLARPGP